MMRKLLYGSAIVALESYLGDAFKYIVTSNSNYFHSFLKNHKSEEEEKKIPLSKLNIHGDDIGTYIRESVISTMNKISFHNLKPVTQLYKKILNIRLPTSQYYVKFEEAIENRHHIFHRGGRDYDGKELEISDRDIFELAYDIEEFINETEEVLLAQL